MLLLHISDIHFRAPECTRDNDPNRVYRIRLAEAVRDKSRQLGPVHAILVGGDIAYRAHPDEYTAAFDWIKQLAQAGGCPLERVFVIPGNHDVDRSAIHRSQMIQSAQHAIMQAPADRRMRKLQQLLDDEATGQALFQPLSAYNEFAKTFNCQIYPGKAAWKQHIAVGNINVCLHGLTSTLLSGAVRDHGQDERQRELYLSPWQTGTVLPSDDTVNVVMSHHPPDWFMDQDSVEDAISGNAQIQLFGHKHRARLAGGSQSARFDAGAVNPDPNELGWHPTFNLLSLRVEGDGEQRVLVIDARVMQWQNNPDMYGPRLNQQNGEVHVTRIHFPSRGAATAVAQLPEHQVGASASAQVAANPSVEATMGERSTRNLVLRLWDLPMATRRDIALRMGLISDEEVSLPEPERYGRALLRAKERNQLEELSEEIDKWQKP